MVKSHKGYMKFNWYVEGEEIARGDNNRKCSLGRLYWLGKVLTDIDWV